MTKRRIHLTEGQLYGLIRQAINEDYNGGLDWKTLYNAGTKASQRGDKDRMYKFGIAARDAFAKKHNMRKTPYGGLGKGGTISDSEPIESEVDMSYRLEDTGYEPSVSAHIRKYGQDEWDKWKDKAKQEVDKYGFVASSPKQSSYRGTASNGIAYGDASLETPEFNEVDNFVNGRSRYIKGKGWNESLVRRIAESVMRKLRESEDVDDVQKYEDALLGASLFWETANYPYYYELRGISDVGIGFNGNVNISNRYGAGIVLTPQEADELVERGVVQTGDLYGTVMLYRNPQERGEALRQMVNILKTHHPNLR